MRRNLIYSFTIIALLVLYSCQQRGAESSDAQHPMLILQKADVPDIVEGIDLYPLLEASFQEAKDLADKGIEAGIVVPFPKDPGGGYTHEKHKQNYLEMYSSGLVYQLTKDERYAIFVRDMLMEYQVLYPGLGLHPMQKNQAPGKIFWQGLNESVWLVYTIQAYDCIFDFLSKEERHTIEENLFRKVVKFFTEEDSYSFDRVHNHGTWAVAGVGMTGMVLGDSMMIEKALYSTKLDGSGGFLRQMDELFSPDGYYGEGPYYQRYALMPFILFAQALENNRPDLKIFEYKDGVLVKAVNTVLQLTNSNGDFYPINDAIKEKSWLTPELIFGTNIVFALTENGYLLDVAKNHGKVMISAEGLKVARSIANGEAESFSREAMVIRDGENGDRGGLALLRLGENEDQSSVLFKFSSQGMGHGHFDRLEFLLYDKGQEIIPDYGAARFLNVVAKEGGRYLPENKTWAKQTVAHNTVVVNRQSDFGENLKEAEAHSPQLIFAELEDEAIQIVSATDAYCYESAVLNRTLAFFELDGRRYLVDLFNIKNETTANYDLPIYFNGQLLDFNFPYTKLTKYMVLGEENGYQHLLVEARADDLPATSKVSWMNGKGFYTMSALTDPGAEFYITRLGANDPDFNLRAQSGMMLRYPKSKDIKLLTVIEIHGNYNPVSESVLQSEGSIRNMHLFSAEDDKVLVRLELKNDKKIELALDLKFMNAPANEIQVEGRTISWEGNYNLSMN